LMAQRRQCRKINVHTALAFFITEEDRATLIKDVI
jgi:hypothetical protein